MRCYISCMEIYKVAVYVPEANADEMRRVIGDAGGGKIGAYSHSSFSTRGIGRFIPLPGANPSIGTIGKPESIPEERIEFVCDKAALGDVIAAIRKVHPYEEPAIDVWKLEPLP